MLCAEVFRAGAGFTDEQPTQKTKHPTAANTEAISLFMCSMPANETPALPL